AAGAAPAIHLGALRLFDAFLSAAAANAARVSLNGNASLARRERRFTVPGLSLAAVEWGDPDGLPVLAAHGWLDNAGSFDLLAPLLHGCRTVSLDLAGHGASGFRSPDASYDLWQDVDDLLDVTDELGWPRACLLGH